MNDYLSETNSEKEMPDTPMVDLKSVNIGYNLNLTIKIS